MGGEASARKALRQRSYFVCFDRWADVSQGPMLSDCEAIAHFVVSIAVLITTSAGFLRAPS